MPHPMRGCVIVHGLSGTPGCVASLKDPLMQAGFRVSTPCLAGHGGSVNDLARTTWEEWYETVRIAFGELRRSCDQVYYAGISLGALLGLKLALEEGWGIRALALLATPLALPRLERLVIPVVKYTPLRLVVKSVKKDWEKSVKDRHGRLLYERLSLPRVPLASVYEICALQDELLRDLKNISNPLLLVHARHDRVAPPKNVELVQKSISSDIVETLWLEESEHVITMDMEKELVARRVVQFFEAQT